MNSRLSDFLRKALAALLLFSTAHAALAADAPVRRTELLSLALADKLPGDAKGDAYYEVLMALALPGGAEGIDRSALLRLRLDLEGELTGNAVKAAQARAADAINQMLNQDLEDLRKAADAGMMQAQADLAEIYFRGIGIEPDMVLAEKYARLAAGQDYAPGEYLLGAILLRQEKNEDAVGWLEKAAKQNDAQAQFALALLLIDGRGISRDVKRAIDLLTQSAGTGYAAAQAFLAELLARGEIFPADPDGARMWAMMARNSGALPPEIEAKMDAIVAGNGKLPEKP